MTNELLQKYIQGTASVAERKAVTLWLMQSTENQNRYRAERKIFESSLWQDDTVGQIETTLPAKEAGRHLGVQTKILSLRHVVRECIKVAAIVAITLASVVWFSKQPTDNLLTYQEMVVPAGQRAELNLADGTRVWLNSGSTLTFPTTFSDEVRTVKLNGEGYFEVAKNASCPFVVETNKGNIRVLGTEFNVLAYASDDEWETSLLKGSVEIYRPQSKDVAVRLEPNTKVSIQNEKFVKADIGETSRFLWREGMLCFSNISVKQMLEKVELYYGVSIQVKQNKLLEQKYTGKFRTRDGVEHVLKVLKLNHDFNYIKNDDKNMIIIY